MPQKLRGCRAIWASTPRRNWPIRSLMLMNVLVTIHSASSKPKLTIGFPRYRIYYYNTTERPVGVDLYVYLTN